MNNKIKKWVTLVVMVSILTTSIYSNQIINTKSVDPAFSLTMKVHSTYWQDYANFIKQHIARIGIDLQIIVLDWPTYVGELLVYHDFDLIQSIVPPIGLSADLRGVYDENGSLNIYGYTTDMDYNEALGTGVNEWYLEEGGEMRPKYSQ